MRLYSSRYRNKLESADPYHGAAPGDQAVQREKTQGGARGLTLAPRKQVLAAIRQRLRRERHRLNECRWARLLSTFADHVLCIVNSAPRHAKDIARRLEPLLLVEILDQ